MFRFNRTLIVNGQPSIINECLLEFTFHDSRLTCLRRLAHAAFKLTGKVADGRLNDLLHAARHFQHGLNVGAVPFYKINVNRVAVEDVEEGSRRVEITHTFHLEVANMLGHNL